MPSYDYQCRDCNTRISVTRSISEKDPGYSCEKCSQPMTRSYSVGAIKFNGSGFYRTDNASR
jgi:putative FmdB family regulatory protein